MARTARIIPLFDVDAWQRGMDHILGTAVKDPLIRWSQRNQKRPTTACQHCGIHYTTLGITRHEAKCAYNPAVKRAKRRAR